MNPNITSTAEWTIMAYVNGDHKDIGDYAFANLSELNMGGPTPKVNIIVLWDKYNKTRDKNNVNYWPNLYKLENNKSLNDLDPLLDLQTSEKPVLSENMGNPKNLEFLMTYSKSRFRAQKYMLIIWDHGGGISTSGGFGENVNQNQGIQATVSTISGTGRRYSQSERIKKSYIPYPLVSVYKSKKQNGQRTSDDESLLVSEVQKSIKKTFENEKIDILAYDACWMQMLENAFTLKDCTKYLIGSESLMSGRGLNYGGLAEFISGNPATDALNFSKTIINETYDQISGDTGTIGATISCLQLEKTDEVIYALDELSAKFTSNINRLIAYPIIQKARFFCLTFYDVGDPYNYNLPLIDLVFFIEKLQECIQGDLAEGATEGTQEFWDEIRPICSYLTSVCKESFILFSKNDEVLIEKKEREKNWGASGVSIFFPEDFKEWKEYAKIENWYSKRYGRKSYTRNPFAINSKWSNFLELYFKWQKKQT